MIIIHYIFMIYAVPVIPDNIDFLVPMSVPNLMHLVASFAQYWEMIGQLLKLEEEVEKLKKAPYTNHVKMTLLLESWASLEEEFSWLNLLEKCEGRHELRPLVANIRQHLLKKVNQAILYLCLVSRTMSIVDMSLPASVAILR